ncbi:MAG: hypothetical protein U0797_01170 [Gemmataceae bacterium]
MKVRALAAEVALYCATITLTLVVTAVAFQLRRVDLYSPLVWGGDVIYTQVFVLNYLENGDPLVSGRTGAPFGTDLNDFPIAEAVHLAVLRGLSLVSTDPCWLINVFYLLGFPLTAATSLLALRNLGIGRLASMIGSVLFTFLPWHYFRFGHLFLASYYLVPLTILVAVWACQGRLLRGPDGKFPLGRWAAAVVIGLLTSGGGVYFAYFGCFFLLVAGVACAARERRLACLLPSVVLVAVVSAGLLAQIGPALHQQAVQGKNPDVAARHPFEADMYGLRMIYLLLPPRAHQVRSLGRLSELYAMTSPFGAGESGGSFLGLVGATGLVGLVALFLFSPARPPNALWPTLGLMTLAGLLLANVAGVAYLFAFFVTPKIRCYNRISVYLAFFALTAVCAVLSHAFQLAKARGRAWSAGAGAGGLLLLALGVIDQTPKPFFRKRPVPPCPAAPVREFVRQVEAAAPPNAMILQLPIVSFPEAHGVLGTDCYDHFRPAVFGRSLRWSYGVVRGRYGDAVLSALGRAPLEQQVDQAALMGYDGLHLDRAGYPGNGKDAVAQVRQLLQVEPIESGNGRDVYFDLRPRMSQLRQRQGDASWGEREREARHPTEVSLWFGSTPMNASDPERRRIIQSGTGMVELYNPLDVPRAVTLRFDVACPGAMEAELRLSGEILTHSQTVGHQFCELRHQAVVPPGKHRLSMACFREGRPVPYVVTRFDVLNQPLSASKGVARKGGE